MKPTRTIMNKVLDRLSGNDALCYAGWRTGDCMTVAVVLKRFFDNQGAIKLVLGGSNEEDEWYVHFVYQFGLTVLDGLYVGREQGLIQSIRNGLWSSLDHVRTLFVRDEECVAGFEYVAFHGCADHWPERWPTNEDGGPVFDYVDEAPPEHGSVRDVACRLYGYLQSVVN